MERAKVTFEYEAEDETNITIAVGDVVVVVDKSDADWWEGHLEGSADKVGFFPASFVELLEAGAGAVRWHGGLGPAEGAQLLLPEQCARAARSRMRPRSSLRC